MLQGRVPLLFTANYRIINNGRDVHNTNYIFCALEPANHRRQSKKAHHAAFLPGNCLPGRKEAWRTFIVRLSGNLKA